MKFGEELQELRLHKVSRTVHRLLFDKEDRMAKKPIMPTHQVTGFTVLIVVNGEIKEVYLESSIEFRFLGDCYEEMRVDSIMKGRQLLAIIPDERLSDKRIPCFVTDELTRKGDFDLAYWLRTKGLEPKVKRGRVCL